MTQKSISIISLLLLAAFAIPFMNIAFRSNVISENNLKVERKKTISGNNYTIFHKNNYRLDVAYTRPEKSDNNILLCIPGAFTDVHSYTVDGLFIDNGKVYNKNKINHTLGGAIKIIDGNCEIFPTNKGELLIDSLIDFIVSKKGSLFQQIQMIEKGVGATYKDKNLFQRRAIVKFKNDKTAIIESDENITLSTFTSDLLELGVVDALYTDMGAWDEGWYRNTTDNNIVTIGLMKTQTSKQSNWVVFKVK